MTNRAGKGGVSARAAGSEPYRVMVVDDSAVIRGLLTRGLEGDADISVVASVGDGQMAINTLQRQSIDVVVLDIEMPVMDGLTAIPKLLAVAPSVKVIMASTLTRKNADVSLRALQAGAADYIPKPTSTRELSGADEFRRELINKVKALGAAARRAGSGGRGEIRGLPSARPSFGATVRSRPESAASAIKTRPVPANLMPDVIAIGSSTGGPQALFEVLAHLRGSTTPPILITQHMPATFTTILAEHISRQCGLAAAEGKDGEALAGGRVYVAPGDFHMIVNARGNRPSISLTKDPPENFCRPAADPMLRSIVRAFGGRVLAVILTGMGQDGLRGCREVVNAGGMVVGQDEATSVVWGMPGAVATAGLCSAVLPIREIGPYIRKFALRTAA